MKLIRVGQTFTDRRQERKWEAKKERKKRTTKLKQEIRN